MRTETEGSETPAGTCGWLTFKSTLGQINGGSDKSMGDRPVFLKILFILFLDRREGREKERDRHINVWVPLASPLLGTWPATQACALTGT